jgi:N-acetylmuramoyl-L-alanine amidase
LTSYTRAEWGSAYARGGYAIASPLSEIYVHHFNSNIQPERTVTSAMARMRAGQRYHAETNGWGDIGYSWCVDDVGNDYEGRGWWRTGAHTYGYNSKGYAVCWLGDSNIAAPSDAALQAIARVIQAGVAVGAVHPNPTIVAHRDRVPDTACCGDPMYAQLDTIRAFAAGAPAPSGDDLTPQESAQLAALAGPYNVDVYAMGDGRWLSVAVGAAPPAGAVQHVLHNVPAVLAWAVEGATASRAVANQLNRLEQAVAQIQTVGAGTGATPQAIVDELVRRLAN